MIKYLILDTDTGVDDALAILYALGLEAEGLVKLLGVTCTFGNVDVKTAVRNSRAVLDFLGRSDIPVYGGHNQMLGKKEEFVPRPICRVIHGENGLGNVDIPFLNEKNVENMAERGEAGRTSAAVRFLSEMAERYHKELAVAATASMTNMAEWIQADKASALKTGAVSIMGGALTVPGNVNLFAESNIHTDPEAAKTLFESEVPFIMTGLDVTLKTSRKAEELKERTESWRLEGGNAGNAFADMLNYYCTNESPAKGKKEGAIHDPMAVAALFRPKLMTCLHMNLTVETEGPSRGRTIGDLNRQRDRQKTAKVCVDTDAEGFLDDFAKTCLKALKSAEDRQKKMAEK